MPVGMEALIHEKPIQRKTWYEHAVKSWFLGTSNKQYCCWRLWVKKTTATMISGMVFSKHKYNSNPTVATADAVLAAVQNITDALLKNEPPPWRQIIHGPLQPTKHLLSHRRKQKIIRGSNTTYAHYKNYSPSCIRTQSRPGKLSVSLPIIPRPFRDTSPPPRVAFIPPPRVAKPLDMCPPTPSRTSQRGVLTGIDIPIVLPPQRSPNGPTA